MIKIIMTNSEEIKFDNDSYTEYFYDGKFFIIKKDCKWIAMYNTDYVISVIVK